MSVPQHTSGAGRGRLGRTWQRMRTVPGLGRDVIALVVLVVLGLTAGSMILSRLDYTLLWSDRTTITVEVADAVAVSPGNSQEVRIAGVKVGKIAASRPTERGTSLLTLEIAPGHTVYDNARAVLRPVNPLNQMYVTIDPGGPPGTPLPDGGTIPLGQTERPIQVEEVLNKLDDRSRIALASMLAEADNALANAPETLPGGLDATGAALGGFEPVVARLQERQDNIRRLVAAVAQISTALGENDERLTRLVGAIETTVGVLAERDDEVGRSLAQLPGVVTGLDHLMTSVTGLTAELDPVLDSASAASEDLPDALGALTDTAGSLREVAERAAPVIAEARPVVAGMRPVTADLRGALDDLKPVSRCLDDATSKIAPWMYDLGAFVYNTNSLFSLSDQNGGWGRGHATVDLNSPTGNQRPDENRTNLYQQGGSPWGEYPAIGSGSCQR